MYNIDNLIKVVEEANENIANTIKKTDTIKKSIDDINQEKYEKVKRWMLDVKEVGKKIGHTLVFMKLPSINWIDNNQIYKYHYHNAAKIYIGSQNRIELGLYLMRAEYEPTQENWKTHKMWAQWIRYTSTYKDFIYTDQAYVRHFCKELVDNWDIYEKECYENLKDWALEAMAEKAKETEEKYNKVLNEYENID